MKLSEQINKLLSPRAANASSKRLRSDCPECGMKLPISPGRYPGKCPGCNCEIGERKSMNLVNQVNKSLLEADDWEVRFEKGEFEGVKLDGKPIKVKARTELDAITKAGKKVGLDREDSLDAPIDKVIKL